jgi:WD40 repeat protein
VWSAQFSADGKTVVTASSDKTARLWEAGSGKELAVLRGHEGWVSSAQFSADGKTVVTASLDKTARLWEADSGKELAVLRGHEDSVWSAQFSADGKTVVTASWDNTARVWRCTVCGTAEEAAATLAKKLGRELAPEERRRFGVPDDLVTQ